MRFCLMVLCFLGIYDSTAQVTITITSVPGNTLISDTIFVASHLSSWKPADSTFLCQNNMDGTYQITFTPPVGNLEFKFTKGSWTSVESNESGLDIPNRSIEYSGTPQTIDLIISGWRKEEVITSTATENVSILSKEFYIPQLNRKRNIWVYLPQNYTTSKLSYPVIYMHDGQNLFDRNTSYSGEWEVDESLNRLFDSGDKGVIVIGIENGGESRMEEYSPWTNAKYGGGKGKEYVQFIVETLKPYIDAHFRTRSDRLHTGIMGSSMGGLISFYAAIEYQDVFSKAGIFSPSFWFSDEAYTHVEGKGKKHDMKIYLLGGELESDNLIDEMNLMVATLNNAGFKESEVIMVNRENGKHNEYFWKQEFSNCYSWLFD